MQKIFIDCHLLHVDDSLLEGSVSQHTNQMTLHNTLMIAAAAKAGVAEVEVTAVVAEAVAAVVVVEEVVAVVEEVTLTPKDRMHLLNLKFL